MPLRENHDVNIKAVMFNRNDNKTALMIVGTYAALVSLGLLAWWLIRQGAESD